MIKNNIEDKLEGIEIQVKLNVNKLGEGGHLFFTQDNQKRIKYLGILVYNIDGSIISTTAGLYFLDNERFEPGKSYITKIYMYVSKNKINKIKPGKNIEIIVGMPYDNKNWAIAEIISV